MRLGRFFVDMRLPAAIGLLALAFHSIAATPPVTLGPFEIETVEKSISAGGFPNNSSNPFAKRTITVFRVKHRGKPVVVPDGNDKVNEFWDVRLIDGAARPSMLLMVTGAWLVSDDGADAKVRTLAETSQDLATWQWLDARNGQPGEEHNVGIHDGREESRTLRGGTLLLVNKRTLLDISTLATYSFALNTSDITRKLDNFYAANDHVRALSPGRSQFVFLGNRYNDKAGDYDYALVAVGPATGIAYAVAFERMPTHFESERDATPEWIAQYFEWKRAADGSERLQARKGAKPAPWQGKLFTFSGGNIEYDLAPTREGMFDALYAFIVSDFGGKPGPSATRMPDEPRSRTLIIEGHSFRVHYFPDDRKTSLWAENAAGVDQAYPVVEKIGKRFNEALALGRHQELFTEFK